MRAIRTRGLAIGLMAAGLSVLGAGTSAAGGMAPADQGGEQNPVTEVMCMAQNALGQGQGDCGTMPQAQPAGEGSENPISQVACMAQNTLGQGQSDCGSQPAGDSEATNLNCMFEGGLMDCTGLNPKPQK